ncbi:hypothetical protein DFQ27_003308 [Actinomortierella ambigua]|uniref:50S ribosomal protein L35 n=1 Tax=Actinomortierella ambigua TaxID=1343610 RepID=A0A9P6Q560_9FUNG|nr:hypothetical protein DFQ27_003308 [Actinomortierella ambigua]
MASFLRSTMALAWAPVRATITRSAAVPSLASNAVAPATSTASTLTNMVRHMSYKIKTNSAAKKRFVALPSGKFKHWKAGKRHLNTGMDRGRLNNAGKAAFATNRQAKHLRRLMPYA